MPKYHVHGTVAGKDVDVTIDAPIGTEALSAAVKPHMPKPVREGKHSRFLWWEENVKLDIDVIEEQLYDQGGEG
jgi:hypothetical protein